MSASSSRLVLRQQTLPLAFQIIPSATTSDRDAVILEMAMQALGLDDKHPIAVEITGEEQAKRFLVRAKNLAALHHAEQQLRLRFPQAQIRYLAASEDPFRVAPDEVVEAIELHPGAQQYLPQRVWQEGETLPPETDPILGVLAALSVPPHMRAIAQIALVPAPPNWSRGNIRKAVEHALEPERAQERLAMAQARAGGAPSTMGLVMLSLVLVGLFAYSHFQQQIPGWLLAALGELFFQGRIPNLTGAQLTFVLQWGGELLIGLGGLAWLIGVVRRHFLNRPLYDQKLVAHKTSRMAYRARIRLYVIGPRGGPPSWNKRLWTALVALCRAAWRWFCDWKEWPRRLLVCILACISFGVLCWCFLVMVWRWIQRWWEWLTRRHAWPGRFRSIRDACVHLCVACFGWLTQWHAWPTRFLAFAQFGWRGLVAALRTCAVRFVMLCRTCWQKWEAYDERRARYIEQQERRQNILASLVAAYRQFNLASGDYFRPKQVRSATSQRLLQEAPLFLFSPWYGWDRGVRRSSHLIAVDTIASLWHLPHGEVLPTLSLVEYRRSRSFPLPACLIAPPHKVERTLYDPATGHPFTVSMLVGVSEHAGHVHSFVLPDDFTRKHTLLGGKSGEGKSTFFIHVALKAMLDGDGMCVVDPHGDLARDIAARMPDFRARRGDVVYLDLTDLYAIGLNPLDYTLGRPRDKAVADCIKTFKAIWWESWGPRMENAFTYALRTVWEANRALCLRDPHNGPDQQYTLLDVMYLVCDEAFCKDLLKDVNDLFIQRWWILYFLPLNTTQRRDVVNPVLSKLAAFETEIARRIVGQSRSTIDFKKLIAEKKILLINLGKGVAGDDVAGLLGATFLGLFSSALTEQATADFEQRKKYLVMVDEFQTITGANYAEMTAELRKYGLTLMLGTQSFEYLEKLDKTLLPTVLASMRQYVMYRMSAPDAAVIHEEIGVEAEDIVNLDAHTCYIKLSVGDIQQPAFSLKLQLPPAGDEHLFQQIRSQCRQQFGRSASEVEKEFVSMLARNIRSATQRAKDRNAASGGPGPNQPGGGGGGAGPGPGPLDDEETAPMEQLGRMQAGQGAGGGNGKTGQGGQGQKKGKGGPWEKKHKGAKNQTGTPDEQDDPNTQNTSTYDQLNTMTNRTAGRGSRKDWLEADEFERDA